MANKPLTVAVLGAGGRGAGFGELLAAYPQWAQVVAVAEPRDEYRESFAKRHQLKPELVFRNWQDFCAKPRLADAVVISTMDRDHVGPAVACTRMGYDMLLEKPMATSLADCQAIAAAQKATGTITCICHSMRYHKAFSALKKVVRSGRLGRLITMDQMEQVAWWHQAHSFVRGNWGNEGRSTFMLLAKSCHDIDYMAYLIGQPCQRVSSYGSLDLFRAANAPAGSGERCTECAHEPECAYSAIRWYVDGHRTNWPAAAIAHDHTREAHWQAITTGPYGRCVWKCDNDVVDHQVVAMEFAGGVTATFTMTAFTQQGGRLIRLNGTEGDATFHEGGITVRTFADNNTENLAIGSEVGGHGGGDTRVVVSWLRAMLSRDPSLVATDVHESLRTHSIVFAAERSRRERRMVEMSEIYG